MRLTTFASIAFATLSLIALLPNIEGFSHESVSYTYTLRFTRTLSADVARNPEGPEGRDLVRLKPSGLCLPRIIFEFHNGISADIIVIFRSHTHTHTLNHFSLSLIPFFNSFWKVLANRLPLPAAASPPALTRPAASFAASLAADSSMAWILRGLP